MRKARTLFGIMLIFLCLPPLTLQAAPADANLVDARAALQSWLERKPNDLDGHEELMAAMQRFYAARQFEPAWMGPGGLAPQGAALLDILGAAGEEAMPMLNAYVGWLRSILLDGKQLAAHGAAFPTEALLQLEIGITQVALYFAARQEIGLLAPAGAAQPPQQQLAAKLAELLAGPTWDALGKATWPRQQPLRALQKSLERYQTIALLGGWPTIPEGPHMRVGTEDPRVPLLRKRLIISGDMGLERLSVDENYDDALAEAVQHFQRRHGLKVDGVVGARTLAELNISVQERITQIRLNMIRWRSLPRRLGSRYLLVNIPGFKLYMVEDHHVVHAMRAIVGKKDRPTPEMSATMTYLEINPYWNIPQKIARKDILPKIQNDPHFLVRQKIEVFGSWKKNASVLDPLAIDWQSYSEAYFPFRLRQQPAVSNALGQVKFIFPNRFSVYIHDTPAKSLFSKSSRSFSSGCVRIEKPLALAKYLLAGQHWDEQKIVSTVQSRHRKVVMLKDPIPVYLVYLTAWADENGTVLFFQDLYERDRSLLADLGRSDPELPALMADLMRINPGLEKDHRSASAQPCAMIDGTT